MLPLEKDWKGFKKIKINENQKIIDIGAHWGESYIIFRKYFKNMIYCYEPNPNSSIKFKVPCPLTEYGSKNLFIAGVAS